MGHIDDENTSSTKGKKPMMEDTIKFSPIFIRDHTIMDMSTMSAPHSIYDNPDDGIKVETEAGKNASGFFSYSLVIS